MADQDRTSRRLACGSAGVNQGNEITIRGRRRDLRIQHGFVCHALEISYSHFERSVTLPAQIAVPSIRLEFQEGILISI